MSANKTNAIWNNLGEYAEVTGRVSLGTSVVLGAYEIATATNKAQAASEVTFSTAGGIAGGAIFSGLGGYYGNELGNYVYNQF